MYKYFLLFRLIPGGNITLLELWANSNILYIFYLVYRMLSYTWSMRIANVSARPNLQTSNENILRYILLRIGF